MFGSCQTNYYTHLWVLNSFSLIIKLNVLGHGKW